MMKKRSTFATLLKTARFEGRAAILDGAVGTELDNRGAKLSAPVWSGLAPLSTPDLLYEIHLDYARAGAEIITACTFRTTARAFAKAGLNASEWKRAATEAVRIARAAATQGQCVVGSVAPLEDCFVPEQAPIGESATEEHRRLCETLVEAGVDVLWLETFGTLGELRAAIEAARRSGADRVPFSVSVTTSRSGDLISGESLRDALACAQDAGAAAFLINCVPVDLLETALPVLLRYASIPKGAYANLGFAEPTQDWRGSANLSPDAYAKRVRTWPLDIVGGCCGATPAHIAALRRH